MVVDVKALFKLLSVVQMQGFIAMALSILGMNS